MLRGGGSPTRNFILQNALTAENGGKLANEEADAKKEE